MEKISILSLFTGQDNTFTLSKSSVYFLLVLTTVSVIANIVFVFYKKNQKFKDFTKFVVLILFPWSTIVKDCAVSSKTLFDKRKDGSIKLVETILYLSSGAVLLTITLLQVDGLKQKLMNLQLLWLSWGFLLIAIFMGLTWLYNLSNIELFFSEFIKYKDKKDEPIFFEKGNDYFTSLTSSNIVVFFEYVSFFLGILFIILFTGSNL